MANKAQRIGAIAQQIKHGKAADQRHRIAVATTAWPASFAETAIPPSTTANRVSTSETPIS